ncbi:CDP-diacylglycerol--glycerol-3-phosphate 3-phosphatidyltransferase, partial [Francisella tularensis subsp. holarctica]|nr:CDP-diacylglycerol--glycerol-3-phosphate 3-phosphatidyltransferase [Francisella tularensis subsp. holarctica]
IFFGFLMLYVAVILTIYSMCIYLYVAFNSVFGASDN